jgi:uncharacterized protein (TIGR03083 family)
VTAVENIDEALDLARAEAQARKLSNVSLVTSVHALDFADDTFDVVHAHQVLQHVADPVQALREMRRICAPGGIVAARDADYAGFIWFPRLPALDRWRDPYERAARANGGEPDAGRRLLSWAQQAGFDDITPTGSIWCFATAEIRDWWSGMWADRIRQSVWVGSWWTQTWPPPLGSTRLPRRGGPGPLPRTVGWRSRTAKSSDTHRVKLYDPDLPQILAAVTDSQARVDGTLSRMSDTQAREPSPLPGWSRGHIATHLARNADGLRRLALGALTGEPAEMYPGGRAARAAAIEEGADWPVELVAADLRFAGGRVIDTMSRLTRKVLDALVTWRRPVPARHIAVLRWQEIEIHHADLDLGYSPTDWPYVFVESLLATQLPALAEAAPGVAAPDLPRAELLAWTWDVRPVTRCPSCRPGRSDGV